MTSITVTGPVSGGTRGKPYSAPIADLPAIGYVMDEFFISGTAISYQPVSGTTLTTDGKWQTEPDATAGYTTRILVVRPADAARFNGTVLVNWQNVTAGRELGSADNAEVLSGFAWVGLSAQKVGIDGFPGGESPFAGLSQTGEHLKGWDPERYGPLDHPGDAFSYDILTQTGRLLRDGGAGSTEVLGGLPVRKLVATGPSQSAGRLISYINGVHGHARVFDAFAPTITSGWAAPLDDTPLVRMGRGGRFPDRTATFIRDDIDEPVLLMNTEAEAVGFFPVRRPDTDRFVFWEVAGVPHATMPEGLGRKGPDGKTMNPATYAPVLTMAMRHVQRWLQGGTPPPSQPRIEMEPGEPPVVVRDEYGNAKGGIRLPHIAAPVATYHGRDDEAEGLASLFGWRRPFTPEQLRARWSSRAQYEAAWNAAVDDLLAAQAIRPEDADAMRAEVERVQLDL